MHQNPGQDWQALAENYRLMLDGELEELAADFSNLTETAQQVLRNELSNRGLAQPGAKAASAAKPDAPAGMRWASPVDPDSGGQESGASEAEDDVSDDGLARDYTWKTPLCECDTSEQAVQLNAVLKRAGIDSWVEDANSRWGGYPRVVVAADQLEQAIEIARQPIPQDIVDQSKIELPEYVAPTCPSCGAEDPVLESAEPANSWLCEACGRQWTEPITDSIAEADGRLESRRR
jgi:ribosomal protein L37AE/L43A